MLLTVRFSKTLVCLITFLKELDRDVEFVKCKRAYLRRKIFWGSFQYKMAKQFYITDLMHKPKAYLFQPQKKYFKRIELTTKILAVKMHYRLDI
jgi:hypothetical protein